MFWITRRFFTLLEVLVVLLILSMGLSLTGIKFYQAWQEQRVHSDVQQVVNMLAMAQDLMLLMDADAQVILAKKSTNQPVTCRLSIEKPLSKEWEKIAEREISLSAIQSFKLNKTDENPLRIRFTLGQMTEGDLYLSVNKSVDLLKKNEGTTFRIALPGYPGPIGLSDDLESERPRYSSENNHLYPMDVYEELYAYKKIIN